MADTRQLKIREGAKGPTKLEMVAALQNAFARNNRTMVSFTVTDGQNDKAMDVQIVGIEYESDNPNRLNFKGRTEIAGGDGKAQAVSGFYDADGRKGYINIPAV